MKYPKVSKGDPIAYSAGMHNALVDLLNNTGSSGPALPIGATAQGVVVRAKNTSGADRAMWETMALESTLRFPLTATAKESVIFNAVASDPTKPPAILQEPISANKIGRVLIFGYTLARVGAGSTTVLSAKPNNSHKLSVDASGTVRLLAAPAAASESVIPVIVGAAAGLNVYLYVLEEDMGATSALASIYALGPNPTTLVSSGQTLQNTIQLASHQVSGGRGICVPNGDAFAVLIPECEPEDLGSGGPI